ncbi:hypothetical protein ACXDF8_06625 [Mycolicibacterium sp. CBM1]
MRTSSYAVGIALTLGAAAALLAGQGVASADPASGSAGPSASSARSAHATASRPRRVARVPSAAPASRPAGTDAGARPRAIGHRAPSARTGRADTVTVTAPAPTPTVSVTLPHLPVVTGASFTVSESFIAGFAEKYLAAGGNPVDSARFFFGDLAVASLDALAQNAAEPTELRLLLGNLAASGYFGGIWLRDSLTGTGAAAGTVPRVAAPTVDLSPSAIGIRLFDAATGTLATVATSNPWLVTAVAHAAVPVLLALYGYNRGYLDVVLDNPPAGVPSMRDTLSCSGFLACSSTAFPLELATRYDSALSKLAGPTDLGWAEMAMWTTVLQSATGAGRFVWEGLARAGFSPATYTALVELSSAYLMVSKAAVLSAMTAYADGDAAVGRASLRLQAGLWMWSGAYFAGLASGARPGTLPSIMVS